MCPMGTAHVPTLFLALDLRLRSESVIRPSCQIPIQNLNMNQSKGFFNEIYVYILIKND